MTALVSGYNAAMSAWKAAEIPLRETGWETYESRMLRYWLNQAYHDNTIYDDLNLYARQMKFDKGLYTFTRGIYNPVARQNNIYVSTVYPGQIDFETLNTGAIPISTADNKIKDAIKLIFLWSNWMSEKSLYVRYGAKLGDSFIKVIDDRARQKVRMEVLDPRYIKYKKTDSVGNIIECHIEYERLDDEKVISRVGQAPRDNKTYTYTEIITKESFETFKDGKPFAFNAKADGTLVDGWDNIYGFVPVTQAQHVNIGLEYGASPYHESLFKIDEINDAASNLNDQQRKTVTPMWYFAGVSGPDALSVASDKKDALPAIYGPPDSQAMPMVANLDFVAALQNIDGMLAELERDMPELAMHRMRSMGADLSGKAALVLYADAVNRITEAQSNYDDAKIRALKMGITMGAMGRYEGFQDFDARSYENGDLNFVIGERPPLKDEIGKQDRLNLLVSTGAPAPAIWAELGYKAETIAEWQALLDGTEEAQEQQVAQEIEALA